jgi:hypothetical protein
LDTSWASYTTEVYVPRILLDIMRSFILFCDYERGTKVNSATILQTNGDFIYLIGFNIYRGIFVAIKDIKVLQVFAKLIKLPLNNRALTRKYWPRYCGIVRNYYMTKIKKMNWAFLLFIIKVCSVQMSGKRCESIKRYRPKRDKKVYRVLILSVQSIAK